VEIASRAQLSSYLQGAQAVISLDITLSHPPMVRWRCQCWRCDWRGQPPPLAHRSARQHNRWTRRECL